jgi:DNA-binding MarR family transcriptional regulator
MAVLTDHGVEAIRAASRTHLRGVDRYFLAALTDDERAALERALEAVIERASRGTAFEGCRPDALVEPRRAG